MQVPEKELYIPPELLGEIFAHCNEATLAAISRASFACLELTSKLLYEDITLSDANSLAMLFRLESTAETPPPLSDRVSAHTTLSLIHSVTLYDKGDMDCTVLDALKPFPPPLPLPILAVSVPTFELPRKGERRSPPVKLHPVLDLFEPRILLLRGRRAHLPVPPLDDCRLVHLRKPQACWWTNPRTRLTTVIQSGASFFPGNLHGLRDCVHQDAGSPLKLVWDMLDIEADPKKKLRRTIACAPMDALCVGMPRDGFYVRAWFATEVIKEGAFAINCAYLPVSDARKFRKDFFNVPSNRVRQLRDAFVEHGVRRDMDWAALDDL